MIKQSLTYRSYLEPIPMEENVDFVNATIGGSIPPQFMSAVQKVHILSSFVKL